MKQSTEIVGYSDMTPLNVDMFRLAGKKVKLQSFMCIAGEKAVHH